MKKRASLLALAKSIIILLRVRVGIGIHVVRKNPK